jgi:hypothetical protein
LWINNHFVFVDFCRRAINFLYLSQILCPRY